MSNEKAPKIGAFKVICSEVYLSERLAALQYILNLVVS